MVQFLSINFFLGFLQFLLGFSKVPVFLCHPEIAATYKTFSWNACRDIDVCVVVCSTSFKIRRNPSVPKDVLLKV